MFGLWTYGVYSTVACVLIHHCEVAMYNRNWTIYLGGWALLSLTLLPLTVLLQA